MRWSIIRLIWLRELRDQLRDRRTLFMIAGMTSEQARFLIGKEVKIVWLPPAAHTALEQRKVDVILRAPPDFYARIESGDAGVAAPRPALEILTRAADDHSKRAVQRLRPWL